VKKNGILERRAEKRESGAVKPRKQHTSFWCGKIERFGSDASEGKKLARERAQATEYKI